MSFNRPSLSHSTRENPGASSRSSRIASSQINHEHCDSCGAGGDLVCCEGCPNAFHLYCLNPPLAALPAGVDWFCIECVHRSRPPQRQATLMDNMLMELENTNPLAFDLPTSFFEQTGVDRKRQKKKKLCSVCEEKCMYGGDCAQCNTCKKTFHIWCLDPPLLHRPVSAWSCPDHAVRTNFVETHLIPTSEIPLDFVPEKRREKKRKGEPFRAVISSSLEKEHQEKLRRKQAVAGLSELQEPEEADELEDEDEEFLREHKQKRQHDLDVQNEHVLRVKLDSARKGWDPLDVMMEARLEQFQQGQHEPRFGMELEEKREFLKEYISKTQSVISKAQKHGVPLRNTGFTVEEAVLGRIPTMAELQTVTPELLGRLDPLFVQFLAWQRLVEINSERERGVRNDGVKIARGEDLSAAAMVQKEIESLQEGGRERRRLLQQAVTRAREADAWAAGTRSVSSFLDSVTAVAVELNVPIPGLPDPLLPSSQQLRKSVAGQQKRGRRGGDDEFSEKKKAKKDPPLPVQPPAGPVVACITCVSGGKETRYNLHESQIAEIGRREPGRVRGVLTIDLANCDAWRSVSRLHARIRKNQGGEWQMQLLGRNGLTDANGALIKGKDDVWISMQSLFVNSDQRYRFFVCGTEIVIDPKV